MQSLIEKENIVGYDIKGNPVTESIYIKEIDAILREIDNNTAKLFSIRPPPNGAKKSEIIPPHPTVITI